jgi:ABC-type amino acid transport substrate-binding protein
MKFPLRFILLVSSLFACLPGAATPAKTEIVLGTNVTSAFAAQHTARVRGGSIKHIECVFEQLRQPHRIIPMPWRRAHQEVRSQNIDAFFTAVLLGDAASGGVYSNPLVLENWYWFWRTDTPEPESWHDDYKLGAILGSPQAILMKMENYSDPMTANNLPQLIKQLFSKRIDVVLADKEHFEKVAGELNVSSDSYKFRFFRYAPLGVFFGQHLVDSQPGFLKNFNQHIYQCAPEGFQVSEYEREKITQVVMPWLNAWAANPDVTRAVVQQNKDYSNVKLEKMLLNDARWQEEFKSAKPLFSTDVLESSLSRILRQFKASTRGLITEIIVMDERGFNVGISDMTSDYWQGDEATYLQIFNKPDNTLFFDTVLLDQSTQRFQVQLSLQLYQRGNPQAIGVMMVAIDIEKMLSLSQ